MARMPYPPIMLHKYGEKVLFYIDLRAYKQKNVSS